METNPDIDIFRAQRYQVGAMAHIFLHSFDLDGSVKLMYTKDEIWPVIQDILHDYIDDNNIEFRIAVTRTTGLIVGWMSYGVIPAAGEVPQFAFYEMTSWAAQRLLHDNMGDRRFRLAAQLRERSRAGQLRHMASYRLVINTIVTDPDYRHIGVAGKLLRFAVDRARSADWGIWAQAPSIYAGLFWQNGFYEVGAFGLDLNAYKPPEEIAKGIHGMQLGIQTWRQMKLGTRAEALLAKAGVEVAEAKRTHGQVVNSKDSPAGSSRGQTETPRGNYTGSNLIQ